MVVENHSKLLANGLDMYYMFLKLTIYLVAN